MEKEFATYEQASALKELGFDESCFAYYENNNLTVTFPSKSSNGWKWVGNSIIPAKNIIAPTYSQAFRWFRQKYDLQCWIHDGGYVGKCCIKITGYNHDKFYFSSSEPMEYEEAELACLNKLIEIVKQKQ